MPLLMLTLFIPITVPFTVPGQVLEVLRVKSYANKLMVEGSGPGGERATDSAPTGDGSAAGEGAHEKHQAAGARRKTWSAAMGAAPGGVSGQVSAVTPSRATSTAPTASTGSPGFFGGLGSRTRAWTLSDLSSGHLARIAEDGESLAPLSTTRL